MLWAATLEASSFTNAVGDNMAVFATIEALNGFEFKMLFDGMMLIVESDAFFDESFKLLFFMQN